ncbi:hypothetical protein BGW39_002012 [Mortierella sp. 14UC]|nr:hypothetical protein BGW39_002012 [Mortierella sp. 14UC]
MSFLIPRAEATATPMDTVCSIAEPFQVRYIDCEVEILSPPTIEVIPIMPVSPTIVCTPVKGCVQGLHETVSISTTHSVDVGFSVEVSSEPFGMGVSFTASVNHGFSHTREESTTLSHEFYLEQGDIGYIATINA